MLKRHSNLTSLQGFRLADRLRYNLQIVRANLLKEEFQQVWDYLARLGRKVSRGLVHPVMRSKIEPMKKIAATLRCHCELIRTYFRAKKQLSRCVVEGLTNKAKLTIRKSYGFRTFYVAEIVLHHTLGKLPEPPATQRFC